MTSSASCPPSLETRLVSNLNQLAALLHDNTSPSAIWSKLDETMTELFGFRLFTVLQFSRERGPSRVHSTRPDLHPLGQKQPELSNAGSGFTPPQRHAWIQTVIIEGKTWHGSIKEDLKDVFEDWKLLWSVGLGSVLNIPIRRDGQTIGSLNILDQEHAYDSADLVPGILIAQLIANFVHKAGGKDSD
ncbi:Nn.00g000040.m01.CDS01 [Neocucurbitaria sp. VM-36]